MRVLVLCAVLVIALPAIAASDKEFRCGKDWVTIPITYQTAPIPKEGEKPKWMSDEIVVTYRKSDIKSISMIRQGFIILLLNEENTKEILDYSLLSAKIRHDLIKCLN